jgi:fucose permease
MLLIAAILSFLMYGVIAGMLGTVMPSFTAEFGLTGEQNGNIALAQALGLVIASLCAGPIIDLRGKKTALLGGLILITAALAGIPSAAGYRWLTVLYLILGLGTGIVVTGANALANDVNEARRASTLNFLNLFFGLGGLLTPFVAANLLNGDSKKLGYLCAGLGVVALIANIAAKVPPTTGERGFGMSEVGGIVGQPVLYLLCLFRFLYVACEGGIMNWLASYLISRNIDKAKALTILSPDSLLDC